MECSLSQNVSTQRNNVCVGLGGVTQEQKKKTAKTRNKLTHIPHMYCTADTPYIRFRKKKKTTSSAALVTVGVDWCVVGVHVPAAHGIVYVSPVLVDCRGMLL